MKRIVKLDAPVTIELDGQQLPAREGEPVASAVIASGEALFSRSPKFHRPRGAACLSGACAGCLMRVDGVPNVPTCQTQVRPGMRLERQSGFPDAKYDLLAATDLVFSKWFDHNQFLAGLPMAEALLVKLSRFLSGLGSLPDRPVIAEQTALTEEITTVVIGGGAAGLAAARALSARKVAYVLFEREPQLGGRLVHGAAEVRSVVYQPPAERLRLGASVLGLFADAGRHFLAAVHHERLHLVFYDRVLLATGGTPSLPTFENNDLPGIYAGRAVSRLIRLHGVLPGRRIAVVGEATEAHALATLIVAAKGQVVAVATEPVKAHGFNRVKRLTVRRDGREEEVECDAVALCGPMSPAFELAKEGGAKVSWNPFHKLFCVEADPVGRAGSGVYVAGELRGPMTAAAADEQGAAAAHALADDLGVPR